MVDCGPSRFAIWRQLKFEDARSVIGQLESVFRERSASVELLLDNAAVFHSGQISEFANSWG